jgi:resuscitation-promoting factor RpfB
LEVRRAVTIHLKQADSAVKTITSTAPTLGQALWDAGIHLGPADRLSPGLETVLSSDLTASLTRAVVLTIHLKSQDVHVRSAAGTVGGALSEAGLALQGLDYSLPSEDQALPADGQIRIVRVTETIQLTQKLSSFKKEYKMDADTELDQQRIVNPGQMGIEMTRERIRFEDGQEGAHIKDSQWTVQEPVTEVIGRGTKAVLHTEVVNGVKIQYWRKVTVYATSYSPCRSGADKCYNGTASGMPVRQGVVAVSANWYNNMLGQQIFVPGYGKAVIGDTGGGIPGRYWIDLAYSDDAFQPWHQWVTIYFLAPVPKNIPIILYP